MNKCQGVQNLVLKKRVGCKGELVAKKASNKSVE
jgi:hypothetical protein